MTGLLSALANAERRRWVALTVVCLGQLMFVLDATIVNVALPAIQSDLDFDQSDLTWVVNAYLIAFGSGLLLAGRLGDLFGRRRMFLIGLVIFTAASVLCGIAQSQEMLVAARFIQGAGASLTAAVALAIIVVGFPGPERPRAMGVFSFVATAGGSIGLLLGGVITQTIDWHWIFFINLPIGIATLLAGRVVIDVDVPAPRQGSLDVAGAVLITAGAMSGVYAIVGATDHGWGSAHTLGYGGLAVALLALFLLVESRVQAPIMPLRILRVRPLMVTNFVRVGQMAGMFSAFFLGSLYLERVLGYDPISIGLAFVPLTVVMGAIALFVYPRAMRRFGNYPLVLGGLTAVVGALLLLSQIDVDTAYLPLLGVAFVLFGAGLGFASSSLFTVALSEVPHAEAGLGSGIVQVTMQLSGAAGLAVLTTLAHGRTASRLADGEAPMQALVAGYDFAFLIAAVAVACSIAIAAIGLRPGRAHAAEPPRASAAADSEQPVEAPGAV